MAGRKSIHLARAGVLTPRERLWDAARKLSKKGAGLFTLLELQDAAKPVVNMNYARWYRNALVAAGYLVPAGIVPLPPGQPKARERFQPMRYRLAKDQLDAPRLNADGTPTNEGACLLAMWRAMQVLKVFDYRDVQRAASVPGFEVRLASANSYVRELAKAGYFALVEESSPGKLARYRLVKNTGMHAPAVCKRHMVFDRNLGEVMWQQSEQEMVDGLQ